MFVNARSTPYLFEHHILPGIRDELVELGLFLDTTEAFLQSIHDEKFTLFVSEHRARGVQILPDGTPLEEFFDTNFDAFPEGRLTRHLRNSFVVSFYSFMESSLLDICRYLRRKDVQITASDIRGDNELDRAKLYIDKVLGADFPSAGREWDELHLSRRVRNCIVHSAGEVTSDSQNRRPIAVYAKAHPELLQLRGDLINVKRAYCDRMTEVGRKFFGSLGQSLIAFSTQNESNLESIPDAFGEFYIGRELGAAYYAPPPEFDANEPS